MLQRGCDGDLVLKTEAGRDGPSTTWPGTAIG